MKAIIAKTILTTNTVFTDKKVKTFKVKRPKTVVTN